MVAVLSDRRRTCAGATAQCSFAKQADASAVEKLNQGDFTAAEPQRSSCENLRLLRLEFVLSEYPGRFQFAEFLQLPEHVVGRWRSRLLSVLGLGVLGLGVLWLSILRLGILRLRLRVLRLRLRVLRLLLCVLSLLLFGLLVLCRPSTSLAP
jgi:hypothetical protein